jgi:hypothetical protein
MTCRWVHHGFTGDTVAPSRTGFSATLPPSQFRIHCDAGGADLEPLFVIARGRMLTLFSLHLSVLFRFMASNDAARRGTENGEDS